MTKMTEDKPQYKLTYFDAKGSVESARLIFAYVGVEYEDIRIPIGALTPEKKREMSLTLGYLPSLEVDGQVFTQYMAIARYLAIKFGLAGETELESLRMEECVYLMAEYFRKWVPIFYCCSEELKAEARNKIMATDTPRVMEYYDKLLQKNQEAGNNWLVGKKLSWADIVFTHSTSSFKDCLMKVDILENYPRLQELRERVLDQPGIKEYIANRPKTNF